MAGGSLNGISNNPSGKASDVQHTAQRLKSAIASGCTDAKIRQMVGRVIGKACRGDHASLQFVFEQMCGRPKPEVENIINANFKLYVGFNPDSAEDETEFIEAGGPPLLPEG